MVTQGADAQDAVSTVLAEITAHRRSQGDVDAIVERITSERDEAVRAGLELRLALGATSCHVTGDRRRLLQVLWNLVRNAIKFTPAGGKIEVSSMNRSRLADARVQPDLVIAVRDTGVGIDPASIERVFLAFEQESMGSVRSQGLGLGLTISRALAELHGGRLVAQSDGKGKGCVFALTLPTVLPPVETKALAPSS